MSTNLELLIHFTFQNILPHYEDSHAAYQAAIRVPNDKAQAQRETEIEPDGVRDDIRGKSVALVADGTRDHGAPHIVQITATELT
jgi:hypothetical protein